MDVENGVGGPVYGTCQEAVTRVDTDGGVELISSIEQKTMVCTVEDNNVEGEAYGENDEYGEYEEEEDDEDSEEELAAALEWADLCDGTYIICCTECCKH